MATKRRSSKEILAIIEAAIQKASDEGRDFADTSLDMPGEEVSPLTGYGVEADEIFAENNILSGTQLGQYIARLKEDIAFVGPRQEVAQSPIAETAIEPPPPKEDRDIDLASPLLEGISRGYQGLNLRQDAASSADSVEDEAIDGDEPLSQADLYSLFQKRYRERALTGGDTEIDPAAVSPVSEEVRTQPGVTPDQRSPDAQAPLAAKSTVTVPEEAAVDAGPKETLADLLGAGRQQGPPQPPGDLGPGKAEAILGILEVLGGLGGKIAQGRAMRRADKKTEQSQRVANLINALSRGRAGAQATTARPRMGTGGQVLSALGGVGRMGGRLVDAQKKAKATEYEQELAGYRAQTDRGRVEATSGRMTDKNIRAALDQSLTDLLYGEKTPLEAVAAYAASNAHLSPEEQAKAKADFQARAKVALQRAEKEYLLLNERPSTSWDMVGSILVGGSEFDRAWDQGILKESQGEVLKIKAALGEFYKEKEPPKIDSKKVGTFTRDTIDAKRGTGEGLSLHGITTDVMDRFIALEDGTKSARKFAEAYKEGVSEKNRPLVDNVTKEYSDLWNHNITSLQKEAQNAYFAKIAEDDAAFLASGKRSDRINLAIADLDAFAAQVDIKKAELAGTEIRGPLLGRLVPTLQWLHPFSVTYDETLKGFALSVAAALNRGRPSNADFDAALAMIPKRSDAPEVADMKWASILEQAQAARDALMSQYMVSYNDVLNQTLKDKGYLGHSEDADPEVILKLRAEALEKYKEGLAAYQGSTVYSESDMKLMRQRQGATRYEGTGTTSDALLNDVIGDGGEATTEGPTPEEVLGQ